MSIPARDRREPSDRELIDQITLGCQPDSQSLLWVQANVALETLIQRYHQPLSVFLKNEVIWGNQVEHLIPDVVIQVFTNLHRRIKAVVFPASYAFETETDSTLFSHLTWLARLRARSECRRWLKLPRRSKTGSPAGPADSPESSPRGVFARVNLSPDLFEQVPDHGQPVPPAWVLDELLAEFPAPHRDVIKAFYLEGKTVEEILRERGREINPRNKRHINQILHAVRTGKLEQNPDLADHTAAQINGLRKAARKVGGVDPEELKSLLAQLEDERQARLSRPKDLRALYRLLNRRRKHIQKHEAATAGWVCEELRELVRFLGLHKDNPDLSRAVREELARFEDRVADWAGRPADGLAEELRAVADRKADLARAGQRLYRLRRKVGVWPPERVRQKLADVFLDLRLWKGCPRLGWAVHTLLRDVAGALAKLEETVRKGLASLLDPVHRGLEHGPAEALLKAGQGLRRLRKRLTGREPIPLGEVEDSLLDISRPFCSDTGSA